MENREFYYRQMLDLQEKCRRSEEERIRLDEKYKHLVQESQVRHEACINRLRLRYMRFLEEQRARDERNNKLLGALDKVDSNLALIATKTQRLNNIKKKYRIQVAQVEDERAGDSGVASQNDHLDEKLRPISKERTISRTPLASTESLYSRCNYHGSVGSSTRIHTSCIQASSPLISPRRLYHYSSQSPSLRSSQVRIPFVYGTHADSNYQSFARASPYHEPANDFGISADSSRFYTNLRSRNLRSDYTSGLSADVSPRDYRNDVSSIIERSSNLLVGNDRPKYTSTPYKYASTPLNYSTLEPPSYNCKSFESLENKLERYIQQIRELHEKIELADRTAEDEYNTSGDLLNESLSEDRVVNEKTDLDSASKSRPEPDENTGATAPDEDKLGRSKNIDEDDRAGAADEFTTPADVPASDKCPEFVAPVIDQNNTIAPPLAGEIASRHVEVAKEIADQVPAPSADESHKTEEKSADEKLEDLRSGAENENKGGEGLEAFEEKVIQESQDNRVEDKDFTEEEKHPEQSYEGNAEEHSQPQNEERSDQDYQQEQGYYQEYQPGNENQVEYTEEYNQNYQNYDQNYDQYQYEQDPNQFGQDPNKYEQDPNQYQQDPNQFGQDPNQYEQDPNQFEQDPNQYEKDPNQYEQDPNQFGQDSNQYEQDPNQYEQDPNQYEQDSNHYHQDPNQFEQDPNQYNSYDQGNSNEPNNENSLGQEYQNVKQDERETEDTSKEKDNSESESTIERNTVSNAQSDFDFN